MTSTSLRVGSRSYVWPARAPDALKAALQLLDEEERRILRLRTFLVRPQEDILIHLVRMYLFRFAVPAVEIECGQLAQVRMDRVRERLWLCLYGRALDDIVDGDSRFFSPGDSALLLTEYGNALGGAPGRWFSDDASTRRAVAAAAAPGSFASGEGAPREGVFFDALSADVSTRVEYFVAPTDQHAPERAPLLRRFLGVTLGGCDLDDVIADGVGRASTLLSRAFHAELSDDEGKVRLAPSLFHWYGRHAAMLVDAASRVATELRACGAEYSADVVDEESRRLRADLVSLRLP